MSSELLPRWPVILSVVNAELSCDFRRTDLSETCVRCLLFFLRHPGEIITREQIHEACWQSKGVYVSDASVRQVIAHVRRALQAVGAPEGIIVTQPRQGYMLTPGMLREENDPPFSHSAGTALPPEPSKNAPVPDAGKTPSLSCLLSVSGPGNVLLFTAALLSLLASFYVWQLMHPDYIEPIRYIHVSTTETGSVHYIQQHYRPPAGDFAAIHQAALLGNLTESDRRYIYINRTDLDEYISAFLCRAPMEKSDARCVSLIIVRGDHGY